MATFVHTLKRAISGGKEPDTPCAGGALGGGASPSAALGRSSSIAASPSFSDFSLGLGPTDVEHEYNADRQAPAAPRRSSLEEFMAPMSPRWLSRTPAAFRGAGPPPSTASINIPRAAGEPAGAKQPLEQAQSVTLPARRREGKIGGMDYYDYCELIRSSSL